EPLEGHDLIAEASAVGRGVVEGRERTAGVGDVEARLGHPEFTRHTVRHVHANEVLGGRGRRVQGARLGEERGERGSGAERGERRATADRQRASANHCGFLQANQSLFTNSKNRPKNVPRRSGLLLFSESTKACSTNASLLPAAKRTTWRAAHCRTCSDLASAFDSATLSPRASVCPSSCTLPVVSIGRPNSLVRNLPAASKFSNRKPAPSSVAWQPRHNPSVACRA